MEKEEGHGSWTFGEPACVSWIYTYIQGIFGHQKKSGKAWIKMKGWYPGLMLFRDEREGYYYTSTCKDTGSQHGVLTVWVCGGGMDEISAGSRVFLFFRLFAMVFPWLKFFFMQFIE